MADPSKFIQITAVPRPPGGGGASDFTIFGAGRPGLYLALRSGEGNLAAPSE